MAMNGVQLCARFSLATNRLRYCGPSDADALLYRTIVDGAELEQSRAALERFEALGPYLRAIAEKHGLKPFDYEVVEAYWIGNKLLDGFTREEFRGILSAFVRRGIPRPVAERLSASLPPHPFPHHAFHVTFVGVGAVSGKVPTSFENMEMCRPSWGRVIEIGNRFVVVARPVLAVRDGRLHLGTPVIERREVDPRVVPEFAVGDTLAFHWGWAATVLEPEQHQRLEAYTRAAFEASSQALRGLTLP